MHPTWMKVVEANSELLAALQGTRYQPVPCPFPHDLLLPLMVGGGEEAAAALDGARNGPRAV